VITPQTEEKVLAQALGLPADVTLYVKREDLHPYGSHKGRSIPVMIETKVALGARDFVISSSGNAALAAIRYIKEKNTEGAGLSLSVLIGRNISADKKMRLIAEAGTDTGNTSAISITETERPLQSLLNLIKGEQKESLRQSLDDSALTGYRSLAEELANIPNLRAVFIPTSSGTCAQALAEYFALHSLPITIQVVQTSTCHPLAETLGARIDARANTETSIADAIVDKVAHRRESLKKTVSKNGGIGWIVSNETIEQAQRLLKEKSGIEATGNGALGLAGLIDAIKMATPLRGTIACVITGK
jgi:threonine synthase